MKHRKHSKEPIAKANAEGGETLLSLLIDEYTIMGHSKKEYKII